MNLQLVVPARRHKKLWYAWRQEFLDAGETHIPGGGGDNIKTYCAFLRKRRRFSSEKTVPKDFVPDSLFFLMDENEAKILGIVSIRHRLNDHLLNNPGGHIGYAIAPSERRKGYGAKQLHLALEVCRGIGLSRALVTCRKANIASAKTIQNNGGVLEDERLDKDGNTFQRYWIAIEPHTPGFRV